jgi:uncharacterized membrane protein YagU involved in acid resistance
VKQIQYSGGALAGFVGGILGTLAMNGTAVAWTLLSRRIYRRTFDPRSQREWNHRLANAGVGRGHFPQSEPRSHHRTISPSERLAALIFRKFIGRPATRRDAELLGTLLHFGFGGSVGAIYGAVAESRPAATVAAGTLFGSAVWIIADEIGISVAGIADPPQRTPPRLHAYALAGHLAYGLTTEAARRVLTRRHASRHT